MLPIYLHIRKIRHVSLPQSRNENEDENVFITSVVPHYDQRVAHYTIIPRVKRRPLDA